MSSRNHLYNVSRNTTEFVGIAQLAAMLDSLRPPADHALEQFHMTWDSMMRQAEDLITLFQGKRVLFLGDDDHISVLLAAFGDIEPVVYEIDPRVVKSLREWATKLQLLNFSAIEHDIRVKLNISKKTDAFYINPPYSSRNHGYGIKFWITRALENCTNDCCGVIVMPSDEHLKWVNDNWIEVQRFVAANGCRIMNHHRLIHVYNETNDLALKSENLYVRRYDASLEDKEDARPGEKLYR